MNELGPLRDLALALGIGLLIGVERGWRLRGEADGNRVAGIRTFALLGLLGGILGLIANRLGLLAAAGGLGVVAIIAFGYRAGLTRDPADRSATAAITAILTLFLGMLATLGYTTVAVVSAGATVVILALREQLHGWLKTLDQTDMHATARYAVIALIVLPLLPDHAYGPYAAWNPRQLWMMVVLVTGLSFAGYVAGKRLGAARGTLAAAAIAATVSSTAVISELSRRLRNPEEDAAVLKAGIAAASGVMFLRVLLLTAILATSAFPTFALVIAPAALLAVLWAVPLALRAQGNAGKALPVRNPFEVLPALGFAAVVAVMVLASRWAIERFGDSGLATLLALIGLYDVDSGIITVGNLPSGALSPHMAGLLLMLPVIVNTVLKGVIAIVFAGPSRGVSASLPLMVAAAVAGAGLAVGWLLL
ncbi:hypothetical protein BSL82_09240 [Tardibacter chloracetimidivorans]|uniref:Uncharacterized protein n=1 Tax=Tardibacter chloracetimidivorans TaxID=1921510 RepID=A0A1L3ZV67_9SPHN|nr:DUF4010 domain-containing protein [Tardibacter chloracetimidivorans]API59469.1 hypothetical protein BSL82_09240 [Tardibacter chloracetimidivorans]